MKIETPYGEVTAEWHLPNKPATAAFVLAHGAGGTLATPQLVAIGDRLAELGFATLRFNFAYSEQGRKAPDRMPKAMECFELVADEAKRGHAKVFLGGRSFGGRVASHLVADGGYACAGLAFLAYPLHPPGKPDRLRDEHLARITIPMLFLQGTRDPFATPSLLHATVDRLPNAQLIEIEGGDHSFRVRGRTPADVNLELAKHLASFSG